MCPRWRQTFTNALTVPERFACDDDRNRPCDGGEPVSWLRDLVEPAGVLPRAPENRVLLAAEDGRVRVPARGERGTSGEGVAQFLDVVDHGASQPA
jgi:hypothetical protein